MKANELHDWIDSLTQDIVFQYHGVWGSICPFSRTNISVSYGGKEETYASIDAVLESTIVSGRQLKEICEQIEFE